MPRSPIEMAAREWAKARLELQSGDPAQALAAFGRDRAAQRKLLDLVTREIALEGAAVIDLQPSPKILGITEVA